MEQLRLVVVASALEQAVAMVVEQLDGAALDGGGGGCLVDLSIPAR